MKGIILAGGAGTRLHPATQVVSKHLLPVYDKPMVFYPLATLMLAGIKDILVITTPHDSDAYRRLLGDGQAWGVHIDHAVQAEPRGIAESLLIGEEFIAGDRVTLILGDNVFFGGELGRMVREAVNPEGATVFAYHVTDPERYGVVAFDEAGAATSLEEKPAHPQSNYAVTGLYVYDGDACRRAKALAPSDRGELEITDLNRTYLDEGRLHVKTLGRGIAWLDTGTHKSLLEASQFIATIEHRQGLKIACLEEVAWRMGFIDDDRFQTLAHQNEDPYLRALLREKRMLA